MTALTQELATKMASLALAHVRREYPNKLDHVMTGSQDVRSPHELHPIFYGSFDWHSNVHGYWLLATLRRLFPVLPQRDQIRELFDEQLTEKNVGVEIEYIEREGAAAFERPYGWSWVLALSAELARQSADERTWHATFEPMARVLSTRMQAYLAKLTYPIRVGTHYNTPFALVLATEYADTAKDTALRQSIDGWVKDKFGSDRDCQAWEPSGDDYLSSALIEAECVRRVLPRAEFVTWFDAFLPRVAQREPKTLFEPVFVSDRTDGKIGHLDGVNLSRAWCWRGIALSLESGDPRKAIVLETAKAHVAASLSHIAGDYAGEHWLATFALLAILAEG